MTSRRICWPSLLISAVLFTTACSTSQPPPQKPAPVQEEKSDPEALNERSDLLADLFSPDNDRAEVRQAAQKFIATAKDHTVCGVSTLRFARNTYIASVDTDCSDASVIRQVIVRRFIAPDRTYWKAEPLTQITLDILRAQAAANVRPRFDGR